MQLGKCEQEASEQASGKLSVHKSIPLRQGPYNFFTELYISLNGGGAISRLETQSQLPALTGCERDDAFFLKRKTI